jgi:two-component system, response regulator, stage 0 sporulation protein F
MNKITILYIDDEPLNLMIFEEIFSENYNILLAQSGIDGLNLLKSNKDIQVVISDMKMPGMNGLEFIINAKEEYPEYAYFILSGYNITPEIAKAIDNKLILDYFIKPLNIEKIESSLKKVIK